MNIHIFILYLFFQYKSLNSFFHNGVKLCNNKITMRLKKNNNYDDIDFNNLSPIYKPKTHNQEIYYKYLNDKKIPIIIGIGPAGSGKTLLACNQAVNSLKKGLIQKIIITRPIVPVEEDIGFLPGNLINKMDPWTRPIFDILLEFYSQKDITSMLHSGIIEISPLAFMRGRTFKKSFIIADEMQNSSPNQMLMLATRIGEDSKLVITGDLQQSDRCIDNGLIHFIKKLKLYNKYNDDDSKKTNIHIVELDNNDIQRNPIVSTVLDIFSFNETKSENILKNKNNNNNSFSYVKNINNNSYYNNSYNNKINMINDAAMIPIYHMNRYMNINVTDLTSYYF